MRKATLPNAWRLSVPLLCDPAGVQVGHSKLVVCSVLTLIAPCSTEGEKLTAYDCKVDVHTA